MRSKPRFDASKLDPGVLFEPLYQVVWELDPKFLVLCDKHIGVIRKFAVVKFKDIAVDDKSVVIFIWISLKKRVL